MDKTPKQSKSKTLTNNGYFGSPRELQSIKGKNNNFHTMTFLSLLNMFLSELNMFTNVIYKRRLGRGIT